MSRKHALSVCSPMRFATRWVLTATALAGLAFVASPSALAQQEEAIEEVVVTGSRLVRRDLDAASPVVVITDSAIRNAGNVTIEETLNEMPQLASDNTSSVNLAVAPAS